MFRTIVLTLAFTLALPFPVQSMPGQAQSMPDAADRYDAMDANKDSRVTWDEFEKVIPSMKKEAFDTIDANNDTALSREEWNGFRQTHGMKQGAIPQGQPTEQAKPLIMPPSAK